MIVCAAGGTTSHFINTTPAEPLRQAVAIADGKPVRIGGGASVVRDFLSGNGQKDVRMFDAIV